MHRTRLLVAGLAWLCLVPALFSQDTPPQKQKAFVKVLCPANAVVEIQGVKTKQTGATRIFESPPLTVGKKYTYTVKATWTDKDGEKVSKEQEVKVEAGKESTADFRPEIEPKEVRRPDVPYVPTPQEVVDKMLEMADVTDQDTLYDLGCGDGRILITAAKNFKTKGVGIDIDPERVAEARAAVKKAGVEKLVEIRQGDLFKVKDLGKASVVTMYLLPEVNLKLKPILQKQLKIGARIVSHDYDMGKEWLPLKREQLDDKAGDPHKVFLWMIGAENKGAFTKKDPEKKDPEKKDPKEKKRPKLDVPYVPTPKAVVDKMLELAKVTKDDVVYDLGCGDGRIVIAAAKKYGCKAVGIDLDPKRVEEARANLKKAGPEIEKLVEIREGNALKVEDIGKASVVTLYLLPDVNLKLRPTLQKELKPGSRVVSHDFDMGDDWPAEKEHEMKALDDDGDEADHTIYLWTIKKKGDKEKKDE
jgi:uncharacterized protein (TIGR03000 family)